MLRRVEGPARSVCCAHAHVQLHVHVQLQVHVHMRVHVHVHMRLHVQLHVHVHVHAARRKMRTWYHTDGAIGELPSLTPTATRPFSSAGTGPVRRSRMGAAPAATTQVKSHAAVGERRT